MRKIVYFGEPYTTNLHANFTSKSYIDVTQDHPSGIAPKLVCIMEVIISLSHDRGWNDPLDLFELEGNRFRPFF